jgi:hypothetical protein
MAHPSVVQTKVGARVDTGRSASVTLDTAPTPGNLLVAYLFFYAFSGNGIGAFPAGWSPEFFAGGSGSAGVITFRRRVQAGDTAGPYTFASTGAQTDTSSRVLMHEIANAASPHWDELLQRLVYDGSIETGQTQTITTNSPALVIATYYHTNSGTLYTPVGPTEPQWTTLVPWTGATSGSVITKPEVMSHVTSQFLPTVDEQGATETHTISGIASGGATGAFLIVTTFRTGDPPTAPTTGPSVRQAVRSGVRATTNTTEALTFDYAPVPGNLLLALVSSVHASGGFARPIPSGWTSEYERTGATAGSSVVTLMSRVVQAGDPAGPYSFSTDGTANNTFPTLMLLEISGQASGTAWKQFITRLVPTGDADITQATAKTFPITTSRPALLLAFYSVYTGGASSYSLQVVEQTWDTIVPWGPATTNLQSGYNQAHVLYQHDQSTYYPFGQTETLTGYVASPGGLGASFYNLFVVAINGSETPVLGTFVDATYTEVATQNTNTEVRIDQIAAETVAQAPAEARIDTVANEVITQAAAEARVDAAYIEIVRTPGPPEANVDAVYIEVVTPYTPPPADLQLDATFLEVAVPTPVAANTFGLNVDATFLETVVPNENQAGSFGLNVDTIYLEVVAPQGTVIVPPTLGNPLIPLIC